MSATLGINVMPQLPIDEYLEMARFVDTAGFSHLFIADSSLHAHDLYPYLGVIARETVSVKIGPLVSHPYTRHPAINLNAMATVNSISGGRALLNMGAGDRPVMELGYPMARLSVLREAIHVIRQLSTAATVSYEGEVFELHEARVRYGQLEGMPLFVTASGPKMLALAGELADGVIFHSGSDPRGIEFALEHIRVGAEKSGRQLEDLVLGCDVYAALSDDLDEARRACTPIAAWFPQTAPQYASLIGISDDVIARIQSAYTGGHLDEAESAFSLVTDEMVDAFGLAGDQETWVRRLKTIESMGVDVIIITPMMADKYAMIRRVAEEILPSFTGERGFHEGPGVVN